MKFSICVPVYNVEQYLEACIESVMKQTYSDFELILVNDGSTDNSGKICNQYAQSDERISVYHKQNEGQIAARLNALSHAKGDYIVFLDSDDTLDQEALRTIYSAICKYSADCIIFNWKRVYEGKIVETGIEKIKEIRYVCDKRQLYKIILSNSYFNSLCIKCMKRSAYKLKDYSQFYHIRYGEDLLQSLDALKHCNNAVFLPNELYNYTLNPTSVTETKNNIMNYKVDFTVREKVLEFIKEQDVFNEEDMKEYRGVCVKLIINMVKGICILSDSKSDRKKLLRDVADSRYYKEFIYGKEKICKLDSVDKIVFYIFQKKKYGILLFLGQTYGLLVRARGNR